MSCEWRDLLDENFASQPNSACIGTGCAYRGGQETSVNLFGRKTRRGQAAKLIEEVIDFAAGIVYRAP